MQPAHVKKEKRKGPSKQTALRIAEVRGAILVGIAHASAVFLDVAPMSAKKAATGSGRADKDEVLKCIRYMIGDETQSMTQDEADAVAIALAAEAMTSKAPF